MHTSPAPSASSSSSVGCIGELPERYQWVEALGQGALARVDLIRDQCDDVSYALKTVSAPDEDAHGMLAREFRIRSLLGHPQVATARELWRAEDGDRVHLVLDYVEGEALQPALAQLGANAAGRLLAQALAVVGWLHQCGVIHGDLKPENLCVQGLFAEDRALLCLLDFGTAIELGAGETEWIGGTPAYLAPYLKADGKPQPKSDLYALGMAFRDVLGQLEQAESIQETLAPVLDRLLHTDADLAYATAEDALGDLIRRLPALERLELPLPASPPFVDHSSTVERLRSQCRALKSGLLNQSLFIITGEAGSGKSRHLQELAREGRLQGLRVFEIRCPKLANPLEPIIELISKMLPAGHPEHLTLARMLRGSALRQVQDGEQTPTEAGLSQDTLRGLARTVSAHAEGDEVLLLIDDLGMADEDTVSFLRILSRLKSGSGPLVVAALEPSEKSDAPAKGLLLPGERLGLCPLPRLGPQEMTQLMGAFLPRRLHARLNLADWVPLAEGLPSTAVEIIQSHSYYQPEKDADARGGASASPAMLTALVAGRTRGLTGDERELLKALALLEQASPLALMSELLEQQREHCRRNLRHLLNLGLVVSEPNRAGHRYRLNSVLLGRELRGQISPGERSAWHRAALEAWEKWPVPFERPAEMLALHALRGGLMARAFELAWTAVKELGARGSVGGMVNMVECFRPHLDQTSPRIRGDMLCGLANCLQRQGARDEAKEVLAELGEPTGAGSFKGVDEQRIVVLMMQATLQIEDGDAQAGLVHLRAALAQTEGVSTGERLGRLYERLGSCHFRLGRRAEARRICDLGLQALGPESRGVVRADLLNNLGLLDSQEGRLEESSERHLEALGIRSSLGDLDGQSRSLSNLAIGEFYQGEYAQSKQHALEALRIKRLIGMPSTQAMTLINLALTCRMQGDLGQALVHVEEALQLMELVGERFATAISRRALALLLHLKGQCRRARMQLATSRELMQEASVGGTSMVYQVALECELALDELRSAQALELGRKAIEEFSEVGTPASLSLLHKSVGRAHLELGDLPAALSSFARASELALQAGDQLEVQWLKLWNARACLRVGRPAEATRLLDDVEQRSRAAGTPQLLSEALLTSYDLLQSSGNFESSTGKLMEAEHLASRLGLPLLQMQAWQRLAQQARRDGRLSRSEQWALRGAKLLNLWLSELEPEDRAAFVECETYAEFRPFMQDESSHKPEPSLLPAMQPSKRALRPETMRRLLEISSVLNAKRSREGLLVFLRQQLKELFGAENSQVVLVGRDGGLRPLEGSMDVSEAPFSHTLIERVLLERKSVLIRDATDDPELQDKKSIHRLGLMSVLCAPLIVNDEPIGVIQFNHRSKPGPFSAEDLTLLDLFALQSATALKNMLLNERLDETIEQLQSSRAQLNAGEQLRALGQISAGVSHDFNNLLTILNGTVELIGMTPDLPASVYADLKTLETLSQTATSTVGRLQMFRGQAKRASSSNEFSLERVIRQAVEFGARRFAASEIHQVKAQAELLGRAEGSQSELREVLLNLIVNAVEAMPGGGCVELSTLERNEWVWIHVDDQGVGLDPKLLTRIFEPFFSTKKSGHGLGLSICHTIIASMGGNLDAEARPEGGTRFRIKLPRA